MSNAQNKRKRLLNQGKAPQYSQFKSVDEHIIAQEDYYVDLVSEAEIESSVTAYGNLIDDIYEDINRRTQLNKTDIAILLLGIGLQVARQYLLSNDKGRLTNSQNEKLVKKPLKKLGFERIVEPVPYDATHYVGGKEAFKERTGKTTHGLSGANHRSMALGHDPFLGWIFGPMNIITETLTKNNFQLESYTTLKGVDGGYRINELTTFPAIAKETIESVEQEPMNLLVALATHLVHLNSDVFTKLGLPLPIINNLSPEFAQMLQKNGIDVYSVTRGASISILINKLIEYIHLLFYDGSISMDLYQIKCKKVLMLSNGIATTTNVLYAALTQDLNKLDVGGFAVTMYRLYSDPRFIERIKYECLNQDVSKFYEDKKNP